MKSEDKQPHLFFKFPRIVQAAGVLLLLYLGILIWDQLGWWMNDEEYHFGFLVPLFVGFVLMERWPTLKSILLDGGDDKQPLVDASDIEVPSWVDRFRWLRVLILIGFGAMAIGGMLVFLLGGVVRLAEGGSSVPSTVLFSMSFAAIMLSFPFIFLDKDVEGREIAISRRMTFVTLLIFPAFIWLIAAPMPGFIKQEIKLFLLDKVVSVVYFSFETFGAPLIKEGNTFILPEGRVGVADACSGIRSLTGCVVTGTFLAAVSFRQFWPKCMLVGLAIVLAVVSNIGRSLYLTIHAYHHGGDSISGFVHDATGYAVLGVTALCLWGVVWLMTLGKRDWSELFADDDEEIELTDDVEEMTGDS